MQQMYDGMNQGGFISNGWTNQGELMSYGGMMPGGFNPNPTGVDGGMGFFVGDADSNGENDWDSETDSSGSASTGEDRSGSSGSGSGGSASTGDEYSDDSSSGSDDEDDIVVNSSYRCREIRQRNAQLRQRRNENRR